MYLIKSPPPVIIVAELWNVYMFRIYFFEVEKLWYKKTPIFFNIEKTVALCRVEGMFKETLTIARIFVYQDSQRLPIVRT